MTGCDDPTDVMRGGELHAGEYLSKPVSPNLLLNRAKRLLAAPGASYGFGELTDIGRALEAAATHRNAAAVEALLDRIEWYVGILRPSPEHPGDPIFET